MSGNIGNLILGADYTGDLDDIIIYNKALSSGEVVSLMNLQPSCCDGVQSTMKKASTGLTESSSDIRVYPNPTDGKVTVTAGQDNKILKVNIYTMTGVLQGVYEYNAASILLDMKHLPSGIYFLKITTEKGMITEKVIRE